MATLKPADTRYARSLRRFFSLVGESTTSAVLYGLLFVWSLAFAMVLVTLLIGGALFLYSGAKLTLLAPDRIMPFVELAGDFTIGGAVAVFAALTYKREVERDRSTPKT